MLNKETISNVEYQEHGTYSRAICLGRFSTWNETLKQAGLKPFERVLNQRIDDGESAENKYLLMKKMAVKMLLYILKQISLFIKLRVM